MAARYWVGGSGTWNTTSTTNWSATSGGAGGASVPTAADDVYFNGSSGSGTVTVSATVVALTLNTTGSSFTFGGSGFVRVAGNVTLSATTVFNVLSGIQFTASGTLTTNNCTFSVNIFCNTAEGSGATINLGSACTIGGQFSMNGCSFNTNNYNLTCAELNIGGSSARTVSLGSSYITIDNKSTNTNGNSHGNLVIGGDSLTFNAGTSTIEIINSYRSTNTRNINTYTSTVALNILKLSPTVQTVHAFVTDGAFSCNQLITNTTVPFAIYFPSGNTTTITTFNVNGLNENNKVFIRTDSSTFAEATLAITNSFTSNYVVVAGVSLSSAVGTLTNSYLMKYNGTSSNANWTVGAGCTKGAIFTANSQAEGTWTVPSDWNSSNNEIHLIGGGGAGSAGTIQTQPTAQISGAGGGGGGYCKAVNVALTPSSTVDYIVGLNGRGGSSLIYQTQGGVEGGYTGFSKSASNTITLVASAKNSSTSTSSLTISKPTGTTTGDLMLMCLATTSTNTSTQPIIPDGWTWFQSTIPAAPYRYWAYKYATAGEPASYTVPVRTSASIALSGYIVTFRNAFFNFAKSSTTNGTLATPSSFNAAITSNTTGGVVVAFPASATAGVTFSTPTGMTAIDSNTTGQSSAVFYGTFNNTASTSGTTTPSSGSAYNFGVFLTPKNTYTYTATGGKGGISCPIALTQTAGVGGTGSGGVLNYTGGTGGLGTGTAQAIGGGGGGGAAGPNGNGANGGNGGGGNANASGGGGGGNGGGSAGANGATSASTITLLPDGGNNSSGIGKGTGSYGTGIASPSAVGSYGGGGAGSTGAPGGFSVLSGTDIIQGTLGSSGGTGGGGGITTASGGGAIVNNRDCYGGGSGGGGAGTTAIGSGGTPSQGVIVVMYSLSNNNGNFFFMF